MELETDMIAAEPVELEAVLQGVRPRGGASHSRRIAFAAMASWGSRAVSILSGLLLIPVLFRHLGKEELGVWLLLGQSWAMLGIFDFGIGPTFTRRIALAKGRSGGDLSIPLSTASRKEIADLFRSASLIFRALALITLTAAWVVGYFYLRQLQLHNLSWHKALVAWSILCAGQAASVWTLAWTGLLIGLGYVGWETILLSAVSIVTIAVQIGVSLAGGGLLALAVIQTVAAVLPRYLFRWFVRRNLPDLGAIRGRWNWQLVKSMVSPSLRCWITTLGGVLILQTDQFFVAQSKGAAELPSYRAAYLLCINIQMLAVSVAGASAPFISQLWQADRREQARQFTLRNVRFGLAVVLCGIAALLISGEDLFTVWLGPGHFSGYGLLAIISVVMIFEAHGYILTTASRATEDEAFASWSIVAGGLKLVFSYAFMKYFGLLGIPLGTLAAQLPTNYWFMTYRGLKRLGIPFRRYSASVILPMVVIGGSAWVACWAAREALGRFVPLVRLGGVAVSCGLVLAWSCWIVVLDPVQRRQVFSRVSMAARKLVAVHP
jgi:O-antigen/teichoic acid export membrane protein